MVDLAANQFGQIDKRKEVKQMYVYWLPLIVKSEEKEENREV